MATRFKTVVSDRFAGQGTSLSSHIGAANKIVKDKLTTTQLALFKKTVFGRFVDMDIIFNSPLVHYILLREVEDNRTDAMTFNLNGTIVRFTKEDFLLVTGLWRTPNARGVKRAECELEETILGKYYDDSFSERIHNNTLEDNYKKMMFENDLDAVKMTVVYYTELAMMGREKIRSYIDMNLFIDVENLEYFNNIDWGNILWEKTFKGLQRALIGKVDKYKKKSKNTKDYVIHIICPSHIQIFRITSRP